MIQRKPMLLAIVLSASLAAGWVQGQTPKAADRARAQALFDTAGKLMGENRYAEACPKYAESYQLDPLGGTLYGLAACEERAGKYASAWAHYTAFLALPKQDSSGWPDWTKYSSEGIKRLEPKLSRLTIESDPLNQDLPGFVVRRDGVELGSAELGVPMPVDGGEHLLEASAQGRSTWNKKILFDPQFDKKTVKIPPLEKAATATPVTSAPAASSSPTSSSSTAPLNLPPVPPGSKGTVGLAVMGVGVVGLAVGTYFGLSASSTWERVEKLCPERSCPDQKAVDDSKKANRSALVSTIGLGAGAVALGVGAYLWLSAPSTDAPARSGLLWTPHIGHNGGGVSLSGSW